LTGFCEYARLLCCSQKPGKEGLVSNLAQPADLTTTNPDRRRWLTLAVMLGATFMNMLDTTIVNVALPAIRAHLGSNSGQEEWVVGAYALAYGVFLIPGGRLGDSYGRRRLFVAGVAAFTLASLLCGLSTSPDELIAWRAVQGACAGLMMPQVIATIPLTFPRQLRGKAFGFYGATIGVSGALGPLIGGALVAADLAGGSWRPVFLVNLPSGIVTVVAALRLVPESRGDRGGLDITGTLMLSAALLLLLVPLTAGQDAGWPIWCYASLAATLPALAVFVAYEHHLAQRGRRPLIDLGLYRYRSFAAGSIVSLTYFAAFNSVYFTLSVFLQTGLTHSALNTGLALTPLAVGGFIGASQSSRVAHRLGVGVLVTGAILALVGFAGTIVAVHHSGAGLSIWELAPGLLIAGVGSGLIIAPNIDFALIDIPPAAAGAAGGAISTAQRIGQAVGIAVFGDLLFRSVGHGAPTDYSHGIQVALIGNLAGIALTLIAILLLPHSRSSR